LSFNFWAIFAGSLFFSPDFFICNNNLNCLINIARICSSLSPAADCSSRRRRADFLSLTLRASVKAKIFSLDMLSNPTRILGLLNLAGKNIKTDMPLAKIKDVINIANKIDYQKYSTILLP